MPRKTTTKQKQKQKQIQNVKQTVIVKLDSKGQRIKRRRRRQQYGGGGSSMQQSSPPVVVYQTGDPYSYRQAPAQEAAAPLVAAPAVAPAVNMPVQFQDVGVGTEGFVTILDRPTKREQQSEFITPVSSNREAERQYMREQHAAAIEKRLFKDVQSDKNLPSTYMPSFVEPQIQESVGRKHENLMSLLDNSLHNFKSMYEPITESQQQEKQFSSIQQIENKRPSNLLNDALVTSQNWDTQGMMNTIDKKLQGLERQQMGLEDNHSIFLGGSEFNYVKPINELQKEKPFVNIIPPERQSAAIEAQVQEMEKIQSTRPTVKYASKKPPKMVLTRAQKDEKNRKARIRRMIVKATKEGKS